MRRVKLVLRNYNDVHVKQDKPGTWHLENRGYEVAVIRQGYLRRGILRGCYILDTKSIYSRDMLLTAMDYRAM